MDYTRASVIGDLSHYFNKTFLLKNHDFHILGVFLQDKGDA